MMQQQYMVVYAKIVVDKTEGISLQGVYFGGIDDHPEKAEQTARDCVNTIRGGTIIPRVITIDGECQVIDSMIEATERFEQLAAHMIESDQIINRSRK